jgi:hypothetical protein
MTSARYGALPLRLGAPPICARMVVVGHAAGTTPTWAFCTFSRLADGDMGGCGVLVPAMRRAVLAAHGYGPELADLWRI